MDLKNNKRFRKALLDISDFYSDLKNSFLSVGYVATLSSWKVARDFKRNNNLRLKSACCILGNGPSLKQAFDDDAVLYKEADVACVNMFCLDEMFWIIRPRYYYVADPGLFYPLDERSKKMVNDLSDCISRVDWDLIFVTGPNPPQCKLVDEIKQNTHIKLISVNCAQVSGFKWFRHFFYKHHLGMPRCQTVINMALTNAINLGYKTIYLYGADHSWTKDLRVDDNNIVCYGDRHVYNTNLQVVKKKENISCLLDAFSKMFKSHYLIEEYAISQGVKIWNCTKGSFVDAYERLIK